ncbi:LacI family DNA-binding transcriptional regulator [Lacisediminihabitans profunda]|uniref:LacI family transcriptional regulator n=1 Tax=Lacisediminihabitans profunda TaxID=2594790 RepID=A0A5C8UMB8_9MICO|nr:LacI family DNA-binding transcriptional regulator [Lacisediminihabitans profunda]TXN29445.1 LacI family transcriptional regulator [Lacisediminihabitans profunda]
MTTVPPPRRVAPTLEAVAAEAGVSRSTVSRVVNGSNQVSPDVEAAVHAAIERLHYIPNRAARSLANNQTMAIALVIPEDTTRFFGDPYFAAIVQGITRGLDESDYVLTLQVAQSHPREKTMRYLAGGNVDGAFVVSHHSGDLFPGSLASSMPVVYGGRPLRPDDPPAYFVDVDNVAAAERGTQYLINKGRTRIATVAGPPDMPAGLDRAAGWSAAMAAAGLSTERIAYGDFSLASGARAMRELLDRFPDLDSVFVASDLMATGAIQVLLERGLSVPGDVAVMGFDDSPAATSGTIQLTTVHQPSEAVGAEMARMMLALLRGEPVEHRRIMETHIVERDSA